MISGYNNERVSYRTRYINFPSTMTNSVPTINKPTLHIIKIRFNNIFNNILKNEKAAFMTLSLSLSLLVMLLGLGLYALSRDALMDFIFGTHDEIATNELNTISADDAGITILDKSGLPSGTSNTQSGNGYMDFGNGGGIDPNSMLLASGNAKNTNTTKNNKDILTSKRAIIAVEDKIDVNPFLPSSENVRPVKKSTQPKNPYYVLPPTQLTDNYDAKLLMNTMVSGIMYDSFSPSAIIKINGVDYFVKKGDIIQGFNIVGINQGSVVIKRGANVYNAKVGRILATLDSNNNTGTYNINKRFGGSSGVDSQNLSYIKKSK
ncbi:MAG: hypothetical protein ACI37S_03920 [Candidatus Gastranaerophilaceae bacterium]